MIHLWLHAAALAPVSLMLWRVGRNLRVTSRKLFLSSVMTVLVWNVLDAIMQTSANEANALVIRLGIMLLLSIGTLLLTLTGFSLLQKKLFPRALLVGLLPLLLLIIISPSVKVYNPGYGFVAEYGVGTSVWQASVLLAFIITAGSLLSASKRISGRNRQRLKWFSAGILAVAVSGILCSQAAGHFSIPNMSAPVSAFCLLIALKAFK